MSIYENLLDEEYHFLKLGPDDYQGNFSYLEDQQLLRRYNLGYWEVLGLRLTLDDSKGYFENHGIEYKNQYVPAPEVSKWHSNALSEWIYRHDFDLVKLLSKALTEKQILLVIHYLLNWNAKLYFTEYKKVLILIEELYNRRGYK
jgi:hypothetical protein